MGLDHCNSSWLLFVCPWDFGPHNKQATTSSGCQNQINPVVSDVHGMTNPSDMLLQSGHGTPGRKVTALSRNAGRATGTHFSREDTDCCGDDEEVGVA